MAETKKCKYCQSEIDKKAKVCPVCKRSLKGHGCLVAVVAAIVVIGGGVVGTTAMMDAAQRELSGVSSESEYITLDEFNQIQSGMSYEQVVEIVGSEGSPTVQSDGAGTSYQMYTWYGNGTAGSNANVTFLNGTVTSKAQIGLK